MVLVDEFRDIRTPANISEGEERKATSHISPLICNGASGVTASTLATGLSRPRFESEEGTREPEFISIRA